MAVTFIDAPGNLSNTYEPIDFTTDRLVASISVEFNPSLGNSTRETVWDGTSDTDNSGGDFSFLYRNSTRSGSGPYTWHVVRSTRWPAGPFRIRVSEVIVPAVGAPQLQPLNYSPVAAWALDYYASGGQYADRSGNGFLLGGGVLSDRGGADLRGGHTCLHSQNPTSAGVSALADDANSAGLRIYGDLTIAFRYWVSQAAPATEYPFGLVTADDTYGAWAFTTAGQVLTFRQNGGGSKSIALDYGKWHFVAARRASGVVTMAADNVWSTPSTLGAPSASGSVLRVAGQVGPSRPGLAGGLADIVIWGSALTNDQLTSQYQVAMGV